MALLIIFTAFTKLQKEFFRQNKNGLMLLLSTLILFAYLFFGGFIFKRMEGPQEELRQKTIITVINNVKIKYPGLTDAAVNDLFHQLTAAGVKEIPDGTQQVENEKWTFANSFLFSVTLLTTIGYGHLSPLTAWGKVFTMLYSAIGIPATLCVMSLYVCRLMSVASNFKATLFRKLKGPLTPVQINFIHISTIMTLILFGCFLIPASVFDYMEDSWSFLDSFYYCYISLTTIGLGDYVPGLISQSKYIDLYRIAAGVFILSGVIVMMFMLALTTYFKDHCYEDIPLPITIHPEKITINTGPSKSYGSIGVHKVQIDEEECQRLLKP